VTTVSAAGYLGMWEQVATEPPGRRAALLLSWAAPTDDPAALSAGQQNDRLLRLYARAFGAALPGLVDCPACTEPLDVMVDVADLTGGLVATGGAGQVSGEFEWTVDGHRVRFRVPSALDLARPPDSGRALLAACLTEAVSPDGSATTAAGLPDEVVEVLGQVMAELDPGAELSLRLTCPACGEEWLEPIDPVDFLCAEVEARARDAVDAVHTLASCYGWSEAEILSLSPWRLRLYLTKAAG
jgi:hypothetical protein